MRDDSIIGAAAILAQKMFLLFVTFFSHFSSIHDVHIAMLFKAQHVYCCCIILRGDNQDYLL